MNRLPLDIEIDEYPKGRKGEWIDMVQALIRRDEEAVAQSGEGDPAALKSLLQWLKGSNWPGVGPAISYLKSVGLRTLPLVRAVLQTDDDEWICNVVTCLIEAYPKETQAEFVPVLKQLIEKPIGTSWDAELDVSAAELLCESRLLPDDELKAIVAQVFRNNPQLDPNEIAELEALTGRV